MSDSVRPHRRQPTRLPRPWDSPGKNTGVGCHFLLQCMKVKSESEVTQSCPTLCDPMDCSPPGSSIHGIFQARVLEWVPLPSRNIMGGGLKILQSYSGLKNPTSKLEMDRVRHQVLERDIPSAEIYLIVSLHVPAGKLSGARGVHGNLACLERYRI